jgi:hypothetical protein
MKGELLSRNLFMIKNLILLIFICWAGFSYSNDSIKKTDLEDSQHFKLDKGIEETTNQRSLAGSKIKKNKLNEDNFEKDAKSDEAESEVRFWEYSE